MVERRIDELLALFELAPWKGELTETYSHGMRQKLIIAGALVHRPEVIVVDEPMVGLDPKSARLLKDLFREFVTRGGTVLMSTHTMEIAEVMCDRIAIVYRGKIAAQGTMDELRRQTSSEGMSLEDLFLKLTGGLPARSPARRRARRVTDDRRGSSQASGPSSPRSGGACSRACARSARAPGPSSCCWRSPASASGRRSSGSSYRVLRYIQNVQDIGTLLAGKMLGVILLAFLSILLLSNLITALSTFFLAKDLDLLVAAPIGWLRLYLAKLGETIVHSSWMVALLALPILTAYGIVFSGGPLFPFVALAAIVPYLVLPAVAGVDLHRAAGERLPRPPDARAAGAGGPRRGRPRWCSCCRFIRPEQLARPEGFQNFLDYLAVLKTPTSPWLPSEWSAEMIMNWLTRVADPLADRQALGRRGLLALTAAALVHRQLFLLGYSKAQEGAERKVRRPLRGPAATLLAWLPPQKREFLLKDMRLFFRDNTQWSQLILLAVLLMIYIFNIKSLPIHSGERVPFALVTIISFLNLGLAGFVLAAVAARFIFPGDLARGAPDVAAALEPARPARACSGASTGWAPCRSWSSPSASRSLTNVLLQVSAVHDGGEHGHDRPLHPGGERAGAHLRRVLSPVRHRERGPDPDQLRRRRLHDGQPVPAGGRDHDRGAAR